MAGCVIVVWWSKPGANSLRAPATSRDATARKPSSGDTRWAWLVRTRATASAFTPKCSPSPGGRSPGWPSRAGSGGGIGGRVRHPIDLPEGYHTAARGQSCASTLTTRRGLPPGHRAVGRCQVDGMPHEPRRGAKNTGRPAAPGLISQAPARDSLSDNHRGSARIRPDGSGLSTCMDGPRGSGRCVQASAWQSKSKEHGLPAGSTTRQHAQHALTPASTQAQLRRHSTTGRHRPGAYIRLHTEAFIPPLIGATYELRGDRFPGRGVGSPPLTGFGVLCGRSRTRRAGLGRPTPNGQVPCRRA